MIHFFRLFFFSFCWCCCRCCCSNRVNWALANTLCIICVSMYVRERERALTKQAICVGTCLHRTTQQSASLFFHSFSRKRYNNRVISHRFVERPFLFVRSLHLFSESDCKHIKLLVSAQHKWFVAGTSSFFSVRVVFFFLVVFCSFVRTMSSITQRHLFS